MRSMSGVTRKLGVACRVLLPALMLRCDRRAADSSDHEACKDPRLEIRDIRADFRDIWARRETIGTGKRTNRNPEIALSFAEEVAPDAIVATLNGEIAGTTD